MLKTVMQFFTEYAKDVSTSRMIWHATIFTVVISWVSLVLIVSLNFPMIVDMYDRYQKNSNINIERALTVSTQVQRLVSDQRLRLGTDRLYVSKFHDNKVDLNKMHFYFFSRVVEATGAGVSNEITRTQNLPLSIFPGMVSALSNGECYYDNIVNSTVGNENFFTEMGVKATLICPIYNIDGGLIGIIGADDVINSTVVNNMDSVRDTLRNLASILGGILASG